MYRRSNKRGSGIGEYEKLCDETMFPTLLMGYL